MIDPLLPYQLYQMVAMWLTTAFAYCVKTPINKILGSDGLVDNETDVIEKLCSKLQEP